MCHQKSVGAGPVKSDEEQWRTMVVAVIKKCTFTIWRDGWVGAKESGPVGNAEEERKKAKTMVAKTSK